MRKYDMRSSEIFSGKNKGSQCIHQLTVYFNLYTLTLYIIGFPDMDSVFIPNLF